MPWDRAASRTRKGNRPLPAIKPYLFCDATLGTLDELEEHLNFGSRTVLPNCLHCLGCVEFGLQQESKCGLDVRNLFGSESLSFQANRVGSVRPGVAVADRLRVREDVFGYDRI